MHGKWVLTLTLRGPFGEFEQLAIPVDDAIGDKVGPIKPLQEYFPGEMSMDQAVQVLRTREVRGDILEGEARRLGRLLAESLEDKEGWHGEERKERLTRHAPEPPPPHQE